jgi:hypothetical protein
MLLARKETEFKQEQIRQGLTHEELKADKAKLQ